MAANRKKGGYALLPSCMSQKIRTIRNAANFLSFLAQFIQPLAERRNFPRRGNIKTENATKFGSEESIARHPS